MTKTVFDKAGRAYDIPELFSSRARVSYGNGKTGLPSVNLLPGDKTAGYNGSIPEPLRVVFQDLGPACLGTCTGNCPGCYYKNVTRNIIPALKTALNTAEARQDPDRFWSLVEMELFPADALTEFKFIRIHDGGDFFSMEYLQAFFAFARRHPETVFYTYTKENDLFTAAGLDNIPDNVTVNCSPWPGYAEPLGDLPQFCYDDGSDPELARLPHCPAVDKNGRRTGVTCNKCQHCARARRGDRWAVYAH